MNLLRDERGIVVNWMAKLVIFLALVGVAIYDVSALAVNAFQLDSLVDEIAVTVSTSAGDGRSLFELEKEAKKIARRQDAKLVDLEVDDEEEVVRVTVRREAKTMVVSRF
jgi:3-dehydroquinate dehydratase